MNKTIKISSPNLLSEFTGTTVATGYTSYKGTGNTVDFTIENNRQKIDITASAGTNFAGVYKEVDFNPNDKNSVSVDVETTANIRANISVDWYNGSTFLSSNNITSATYLTLQTIYVNASIAPANTTKARILFQCRPTNSTNTGTAYFSNPVCVKKSFASPGNVSSKTIIII